MSLEDRGAYITLLCLSFSERLNLQDIQQVLGTSFDRVWPRISSKFEVDEKGLFFNARWELEKAQRAAYMERMRENGQKGGRPKREEKNQQDNQQDNLNQNLNDNHIDRIGYNNTSTTEDISKVSTALSYQGGAGGNGNHFDNIFPEFLIAFCAAYEKTGKRGAVEQAARDAVRTIDGNPSDAMIQLCQQAQDYVAWYRKSNPKDPPLKFMPEPQTWLIQSMYAEDWKFKLQQLNKKSTGGKLPRFLENPNP